MQINGIDEKDNEIVNILLKDGRLSYSDIGEQIAKATLSRSLRRKQRALVKFSLQLTPTARERLFPGT